MPTLPVLPRLRALQRALLSVLLLGSPAALAASPLAALAPASTLLALHVGIHEVTYPALASDLAGLDVATARAALVAGLTSLHDVASGPRGDPGAAAALGAVLDLLQGGDPRSALTARCPALASIPRPQLQEALLALSASPRTPLPAALVILRITPDSVAGAKRALGALEACFEEGPAVEQDGVPLVTLRFDGVPVTVAQLDDVIAAASSADLVRAAVRLDRGSSEPNLASSGAGSSPALTGAGIGITFHAAAAADLVGALPGIGADPAARAARARLQAALRTVPWLAARVVAAPEGVQIDSWTRVDPAGGDPALASLVRCDGCRARPSLLVPADALAVEASNLRLADWVTYLAGIVHDVTAAGGTALDPLTLLSERTGVDLAGDLFPWLGDVTTSVELPAPAGTLQARLGMPAQVTIVPVASATRARDGLSSLGAALQGLLAQLPIGNAAGVSASTVMAVRNEGYRGVNITRIQIGPSADLGLGLVGNWLVLASPSAALRSIVDTYRGGPMLHGGPLAAALAAAPSDATAVRASDPAAALRGTAALLRSVSQPLAFAIQGALAEARHAPGASAPSTATGPDFASLLTATELPAEATEALAGHLGPSRGWTVWQGNTRLTHTFFPVR